MHTGKKIILFGAGIIGRRALDYFGSEKVQCFADNYKAGQIYLNKKVISFSELVALKNEYDIVLSANAESTLFMSKQCIDKGVQCCVFSDLVLLEDYNSNPDIMQFKDIHKGKRCFLVGNGPSLVAEDLTKLHINNEITFGCNAISEIFSQTPWRPRYFATTDPALFMKGDMLSSTKADYKFFPKYCDMYPKSTLNCMCTPSNNGIQIFLTLIPIQRADEPPPFSPDVSRVVYIGGTVMYLMIQIAVFMGFADIFLIGVDGGAATPTKMADYTVRQHFYNDDIDQLSQYSTVYALRSPESIRLSITNEYKKADEYIKSIGVRIYNATRGGVLDMFERVDFDTLF